MEDPERSCKVMDEHLVSWSEEMSIEQIELWVEWKGGYVVWAGGRSKKVMEGHVMDEHSIRLVGVKKWAVSSAVRVIGGMSWAAMWWWSPVV